MDSKDDDDIEKLHNRYTGKVGRRFEEDSRAGNAATLLRYLLIRRQTRFLLMHWAAVLASCIIVIECTSRP